MTLLGNKYNFIDDDEQQEDDEFRVPAVYRDDPKELSLKKSIALSTALHPTVVILGWAIVIILTLLGVKFTMFDKPEIKPKDIEFVLVDKEAMPINKNTKYRSDRNSRAGGEHDPNRKVSMPQAAAPAPAPAPKPASQPAPQTKPQPQKQQPKQQQPQAKPTPQKQQPAPAPKATVPAPRPTPTPSAPKPTTKPKTDFAIPIPKSEIPKVAAPTGGPVTSSPKGTGTGSSSSGSGAPVPSFSPSSSGSPGSSGSSGRFSGSHGSGTGNLGNPGPGNPKGAPGIDALKEPDFGPYMRELQRRIKMNWDPPKGNESKRVILLFSIARDGRLLNVSVHKSSGVDVADKAALSAVRLTAPFKPLPPEYKGDSVDIQFTFDYNVFGASRY